ncbi:OmpA-OmpF porin, OOP family [Candidatus Magnetomoraceae bacterium gMMP-15]
MKFFTVLCLFFLSINAFAQDSKLLFPKSASEFVDAFKESEPTDFSKTRSWKAKSKGTRAIAVVSNKVGVMVNFDTNSASVLPESYKVLNEFAKAMKTGLRRMNFKIAGHTDSRGSESYNQILSERRARSVKKYLIAQDIDPLRLTIIGYGEKYPMLSNETSEGRYQNRRVELIRTDSENKSKATPYAPAF